MANKIYFKGQYKRSFCSTIFEKVGFFFSKCTHLWRPCGLNPRKYTHFGLHLQHEYAWKLISGEKYEKGCPIFPEKTRQHRLLFSPLRTLTTKTISSFQKKKGIFSNKKESDAFFGGCCLRHANRGHKLLNHIGEKSKTQITNTQGIRDEYRGIRANTRFKITNTTPPYSWNKEPFKFRRHRIDRAWHPHETLGAAIGSNT